MKMFFIELCVMYLRFILLCGDKYDGCLYVNNFFFKLLIVIMWFEKLFFWLIIYIVLLIFFVK